MLIKITQQITKISDNNKINSDNMLESMSYVDNLYIFVKQLQTVCPLNEVTFLPSFKGKNTCAKYNLLSKEYENEMKFFVIKSRLFLVDVNKIRTDIENVLGQYCDKIDYEGDKIAFILK